MTRPDLFDDADLNGLVDGRIEPGRAAALSEALTADRDARARIDGWKRQNESLRTLFASVLFEPVPVRLVPAGVPSRPGPRGAPAAAPTSTPSRPSGAVATAVVGMGLIGFALGALACVGTDDFGLTARPAARAAAEPARDLAARAAEAHRTYLTDAARPVELGAADEPRLLRWIQSRLGAPVRIPDLRALGWSFAGGRVIPGVDGPVAYLVFNSGGERLAVSVGRAGPRQPASSATPDPADLVRTAAWSNGPFDYAVTTTRDGDWLARNASALRNSIDARGGEVDALP